MNAYFRQRCEAERQRTAQSLFGPFEIGTRFAEEQAVASRLPPHRFDPCAIRPAVSVDKYQTVAFDRNRYSVPRQFAFQLVTVKGYVDRVAVVAQGQVVATHARCLRRDTMVLDPLHYLATLSRKPGALDHAPVYRDWELPACFAVFRAELQALHGSLAGDRRFVRVLQLLGEHPLVRVRRAIEACQLEHLTSPEAVIGRTRSLAVIAASSRDPSASVAEPTATAGVSVPLPDLNRFDQLLSDAVNGDESDDDALAMQCRECSPAGRISLAQFWGDSRGRDDSSNKALNIQCQDMSAAGRTTVFFA